MTSVAMARDEDQLLLVIDLASEHAPVSRPSTNNCLGYMLELYRMKC